MLDQATSCEGVCKICRVVIEWLRSRGFQVRSLSGRPSRPALSGSLSSYFPISPTGSVQSQAFLMLSVSAP
jgi:hypothetical protein